MTRSATRRIALAAAVVALLALPAPIGAQSPAPGLASSPGPSGVPGSVDPASPPEAWAIGVCTAVSHVGEAMPALVGMGQSALASDVEGVAVAAISAGLLGDAALRALEDVGESWAPGTALAGYLSATGFALVDVGVALAETDLLDPEALRTALGNTIAAYDGWARVTQEVGLVREATGFDCAAVPLPSPTPPPSLSPATPQPSFLGDPDLESRFPAEIAGEPVTPASRTGAELLATTDPGDTDAQQRLDDLVGYLEANGHAVDDISLAFAFVPTDDGIGASITAFRIRGGDAAELLEGLLPLITIDYTDLQRDTVTVDGRDLVRVSDGPYDPTGIYEILVPSGDTIWAVSAADPVLTEIVAAFPG